MTDPFSYPSLTPAELQEMQGWSADNFAYLSQRAAKHDLTPEQLLAEFPPLHRSEAFVSEVLPELEISHILPKAFHPELADAPANILLEVKTELGGLNQVRQGRPMDLAEALEVRQHTELYLNAKSIELAGAAPLLGASDADAIPDTVVDPAELGEQLEVFISGAGWQEGLSQVGDQVLGFLADMGVPVAAVVARGATSVMPFLRSIDWQRFVSDWRYTQRTLMRALKVWRQGGWKEACRCVVLGVMIAMVPGLSRMLVVLGLCGLGALGVRWIASRRFLAGTPLAAVLHRLADLLQSVRQMLARVFALVERVADVVVEAATRVVKHISTHATAGARQLGVVCGAIVNTAVQATRRSVQGAARITAGLVTWVSGWFSGPAVAWS